jgi:peptidoglycan-associated lipoprotein
VREDGKPVVENHSGYLNKNKGRTVLIQGNTDERGGTEYNLALGQKRAEAVRRSMASLGVAESQMEAVSLGEEKPKASGNNEEAWAENRRADIVYK